MKAMWKSKNVAGSAFDKLYDYPRDRYSRDRKGTQKVTTLEFELTSEEADELVAQFPHKGISKNASWMVKDDRIDHSHRFGGKINSAFQGISPLGNGDSAVKEGIWYAPSHTAYAQPTIPRRCNPTKRRML